VGGCLSGQCTVWDFSSIDHRISGNKKKGDSAAEEEIAKIADDDEEKQQQTIITLKQMAMSSVSMSHRNFVSDMQFVPRGINVDRRNPSEGKITHFVSVSEDGFVNIWDTRQVEKELLKNQEFLWKPFLNIQLFRQDGSGELGLSRLLFHKD